MDSQQPPRSHHNIFSDLWLAVPGHDDMLMSTNLKLSNAGTGNGYLSEYYRLLESKLRGSSGAPVVHDQIASDEGRV